MPGSPIKNARRFIAHEALMNALRKRNEDPVKALEPIVEQLVKVAESGPTGEKGDPWPRAVTELFDRLDGRPAQQVQLQGDEEQPLVHRILREVVATNPSTTPAPGTEAAK